MSKDRDQGSAGARLRPSPMFRARSAAISAQLTFPARNFL